VAEGSVAEGSVAVAEGSVAEGSVAVPLVPALSPALGSSSSSLEQAVRVRASRSVGRSMARRMSF
jgi:hypothetical protein